LITTKDCNSTDDDGIIGRLVVGQLAAVATD